MKTYFINGYRAGECHDWNGVPEIHVPVFTEMILLHKTTDPHKRLPTERVPYKTIVYRRIFGGLRAQFMLDLDSKVEDKQVWKVLQDYEPDPDKCRIMIVAMWQFIVDAKRGS